jgi:hypothetical protein
MNFNIFQIQKMIEIFSKNQAMFIGSTLGIDYLTDYDKFLLKLNGVDIDNLDTISDIQKMFYFGMYSGLIGGNKSFKVKRKDFDKWFTKELTQPLSLQKKVALDFIKNRTFNDITGLGNRVSNKYTNKILTASISQRNLLKNKIKTATISAFKENKNQQQLASILRELTGEWARDFSRIADYVLQEAYAHGRLAQIIDTYGADTLVYKQTFPGVCKHCEKNYGKPGEHPEVYKIQDLLKNGNNIGRSEQLPVVGQAHPWARSILHPIPANSVWDNAEKQFILVRNTQGVKRTSKVKITITD